jgi:hypothetical protein
MNRFDKTGQGGKAELVYGDGDFHVVKGGAYVVCAVSGKHIPLEELRYWSVDLQEAYASPEISVARHQENLFQVTKSGK